LASPEFHIKYNKSIPSFTTGLGVQIQWDTHLTELATNGKLDIRVLNDQRQVM